MSIRKFYGLKDVITGDFTDYFSAVNDEDAKRLLKDVLLNSQSTIAHRADDLQLHSFATFDSLIYKVDSDVRFVCNLSDLTFSSLNIPSDHLSTNSLLYEENKECAGNGRQ